MTLLDRVIDWFVDLDRDRPAADAGRTTREQVADYCGIENPGVAPEYAVPAEQYAAEGAVYCERSGREPDPPWIVVARYELPDGGREVLAHTFYADVLARAHGLEDAEAEALALHRAGWLERDLEQEHSPLGHHAVEADALLERALAGNTP